MSDQQITILIDGAVHQVPPGVSVAAALLTAGHRAWRTTRGEGAPRGLFCGIGACFDCLVTLNAQPNVRACTVLIEPDDHITTQIGTGRD